MEVGGQVLGGDGRPTDESRQALTHGQRLGQLPEKDDRRGGFRTLNHFENFLGLSDIQGNLLFIVTGDK